MLRLDIISNAVGKQTHKRIPALEKLFVDSMNCWSKKYMLDWNLFEVFIFPDLGFSHSALKNGLKFPPQLFTLQTCLPSLVPSPKLFNFLLSFLACMLS